MAKVENPRFWAGGDVRCSDCPYSNEFGQAVKHCPIDEHNDMADCPTESTYADHCRMAEEAT